MNWVEASRTAAMHADPARERTTWAPIDLTHILADGQQGPRPALVARTDGFQLMYPGKHHSIAGEPGSGKSWLALAAAAQLLNSGHMVTYFDFEDSPEGVAERLALLGVSPETMKLKFGYVQPQEPINRPLDFDTELLLANSSLIVLDGVTNSMQLEELDPLNNRDASEWMRRVVHPVSNFPCPPAVLQIDHLPKNKKNQSAPVGAQHKMAAVHVQYRVHTEIAFDPVHNGTIRLDLLKDRYGHLQKIAAPGLGRIRHLSTVHVRHVEKDGKKRISIDFDPPTRPRSRPKRDLHASVISFIESQPGATVTTIKSGVTGRHSRITEALSDLLEDGLVGVEPASGGDKYHVIEPAPDVPAPL